jgi:hypothetical protein
MPDRYDIIGDIHGQANKLDAMLARLGYSLVDGVWRHPQRIAIFVGDFIDRGPDQVRSVNTVRRMVTAGSALAVMGNHELNAIAWHTVDPENPADYLRSHFSVEYGEKNRHQHRKFLGEVEGTPLHAEIVDWFLTLPLWLDLPQFRVVHACWHAPFISWLSPRLRDGCYLTKDLMVQATREPKEPNQKDNAEPSVFKAVEALTKGIEIPLPDGHFFLDKDGIRRYRVRVRWWEHTARTYREAAMLPFPESEGLPDLPIPEHAKLPETDKPVLFGHYWLTGLPELQSHRTACVDYSAGNGGPLVAYRYDGEPNLSGDKFIWVD